MAETVKLRLARLPVGWQSQPDLIARYWDDAMTAIEKSIGNIVDTIAAREAAEEAKKATQDLKQESSIALSYLDAYTPPIMTATPAGVVTIKNHQRVYGNDDINPRVTVYGATINTGAAPGKTVRFYYDDPERNGLDVNYQFTVDPAPPVAQSGSIHSVGVVTIPDSGTAQGSGVRPPGYVEQRFQEQ